MAAHAPRDPPQGLTIAHTLAREIPQIDPKHPNKIARILGVQAGTRQAGCTSTRPVRCGGATLPVGVRAPALARVGEPVSYRVVARGSGRDGTG